MCRGDEGALPGLPRSRAGRRELVGADSVRLGVCPGAEEAREQDKSSSSFVREEG